MASFKSYISSLSIKIRSIESNLKPLGIRIFVSIHFKMEHVLEFLDHRVRNKKTLVDIRDCPSMDRSKIKMDFWEVLSEIEQSSLIEQRHRSNHMTSLGETEETIDRLVQVIHKALNSFERLLHIVYSWFFLQF